MSPLYGAYLVVGILLGLTTILATWWRIKKSVAKAVQPVVDAAPHLKEVAHKLDESLKRGNNLANSVEQYEAVAAANNALRQVIADSTKQLAEAAAQVAQSTEELRRVRAELALAVADKAELQKRVSDLEAEVRILKAQLEYFTKPHFDAGA